jgi:murein DD-endopeptidase MepM/ murein hydrolase activator NlpD
MVTRAIAAAAEWAVKTFPERQLYLQTNGDLTFLRITTWHQTAAAAAAIGLGLWLAVATGMSLVSGMMLGQQDARVAQVSAKYERWLAEHRAREVSAKAQLKERTAEFEEAAAEFEQRQALLAAILQASAPPATPIGPAQAQPISNAAPGAAAVRTLTIDAAPRPAGAPAAAAPAQTPAAPDRRADANPHQRLAALDASQDALIERAAALAEARAQAARAQLRAVGLPEHVVLAALETPTGASGGPEIRLDDAFRKASRHVDAAFVREMKALSEALEEAAKLERVLRAMPVALPVTGAFRITSGFGARRDPFSGGAAFHGGIDFVQPHGAPILTTAPGRVTFAGWMSGYGQLVEVDHGFGFRTRYAHLSGVDVALGQSVRQGQLVGRMGSTGRSTGTHLHYEIIFGGRTYDPANFMRTTADVR